jgi:hypothetical protein
MLIVNRRVSYLDRSGNFPAGDRLDLHCRWMFSLVCCGSLLAIALIAYP